MFDDVIGVEITIVFTTEEETIWGTLIRYDDNYLRIKNKVSGVFYTVPAKNILYISHR